MDDDRVREVRDRFARSAFHRRSGMRLERVEPGEVDVALEVLPEHLNLVGVLHGGVIATLADTATGLAFRTVLRPGTSHLTSQLSVTFLAPGREGTVRARGRVVKAGSRVGYAEADVVDDRERLLALAFATFTVLAERPGEAPPTPEGDAQ